MSTPRYDVIKYMPVQRIAQACDACRRKKSRCTGERPTCAHCQRLRVECIYPRRKSEQRVPSRDGSGNACSWMPPGSLELSYDGPNSPSALDLITSRLAGIEDTLAEVKTQLQEITRNPPYYNFHVGQESNVGALSSPTSRKKKRVALAAPIPKDDETSRANSPGPEEAVLANEVLLAIVDTYFSYCHNQPYSFFHEGNFRHHLAKGTIPRHLILAVLASAVRFSSHPYFTGRKQATSVGYANQSWKSVVSSCFTANQAADIHVVQTIALLALFDFTAGKSRHGSAWIKIGMAVRIAQDLRLMLDTATHLAHVDQEERRRVFWSVYLLDRLVSCGRGRPPAILDASCQLQLPCPEHIWKKGSWKKTMTLDELSNRTIHQLEPQSDFAYVIAMAYTLGRTAQYMLQEFGARSRHPPWDPSSDFAVIESDLLHLGTQLKMHQSIHEILAPHITSKHGVDQQCTGPIIFSRVLFHLCYCMLNHPFLLRRRIAIGPHKAPSSFLARAFNTGWEHAVQMIELIRHARNASCIAQSSFDGYCIIVAGSIAAMHVPRHELHISTQAQALLQEAIIYLEYVGQYWQNVSTMALILQRLANKNEVFSQLSSDLPQIADLQPADTDIMWALVDYSTMSNDALAGITQNLPPNANPWLDSWFDLFGGMNDLSDISLPGDLMGAA